MSNFQKCSKCKVERDIDVAPECPICLYRRPSREGMPNPGVAKNRKAYWKERKKSEI